MKTFRGTYTVMITPFTPAGDVDAEALRDFVDWQIGQGIHGLIPLGSTGVSLSLEDEERFLGAEPVTPKAGGRLRVRTEPGGENPGEGVRLTRRPKNLGAGGVMIPPPFY